MEEKTVLEDIRELMADLVKKRTAQLEEIQRKLKETQHKLEEADAAIASATVNADLPAYEKGTAAKSKLETALSMYTARLKLIRDGEYISEAESDAVIDRLLAYEEQINDRFLADIAGPIESLKNIYSAYAAEVTGTEETLSTWQREIHANYNSRGSAIYYDANGNTTYRSDKPVPVHLMRYTGCDEAKRLRNYLAMEGVI